MINIPSPEFVYLVIAPCTDDLGRKSAGRCVTKTVSHVPKSGEQKADDARGDNFIASCVLDCLGLVFNLLVPRSRFVFSSND